LEDFYFATLSQTASKIAQRIMEEMKWKMINEIAISSSDDGDGDGDEVG